jgi:hypothetical protein
MAPRSCPEKCCNAPGLFEKQTGNWRGKLIAIRALKIKEIVIVTLSLQHLLGSSKQNRLESSRHCLECKESRL